MRFWVIRVAMLVLSSAIAAVPVRAIIAPGEAGGDQSSLQSVAE